MCTLNALYIVWLNLKWVYIHNDRADEKSIKHTHIWSAILVGTLHRRNGFYTVQTVFSLSLSLYIYCIYIKHLIVLMIEEAKNKYMYIYNMYVSKMISLND